MMESHSRGTGGRGASHEVDREISTAPEAYNSSPSRPIVIETENNFDEYHRYLRDPSSYQIYKSRWFILTVIAIISFTNALIWIMFSPVTNETSKYYGISPMQVNWLSLVFLIVSIPCGFVASWMLDTTGLRGSIILAAWLNLIGAGLRTLTVHDIVPSNVKYPLLLTGQIVAACGQTFIMFTPAKTAALWFPDSQRATATTISTISNPLGILAANLLAPNIVTKQDDIPYLHYISTGISVLGVLMSTLGVCSSLPPTPPSPSAAAQSEPFFIGIKKLRKNYAYWMLALSMGGGLALFSAITTFLEQILCPQNYSNSFAGLCGALMIGLGALGAFIAGHIADKTKKFAEVTKIGFLFSALSAIAFVQVSRYRDMHVWVGITISLFGGFGFAIYPTSLELAVEVTYPVAEATSTGLIFISGQLQGIIMILLAQFTAQPLSPSALSKPMACPHDGEFEPQDWTIPNLILNGLCCVYTAVIVLFFHADYRRMRVEDRARAENTLQGNLNNAVVG